MSCGPGAGLIKLQLKLDAAKGKLDELTAGAEGIMDSLNDLSSQLDDKIGVTFNFPSMEIAEKYQEADMEKVSSVFDMIVDCTESIYDEEEVYDCENETRENIINFYESLSSPQFAKVSEFFSAMPTVEKDIEYKCPKCGHENKVELKGLQSFFT